jgi:single-stranded DNA-binding protein
MSFHALISGILTADPQARDGQKGQFATATIRADELFASAIAFSEAGEQLLTFSKGDAVAVGGKAKLTQWTGKDGGERHGISLVVSTIAAAKPPSRPPARPAVRKPARTRQTASPLPDDRVDDLWGRLP